MESIVKMGVKPSGDNRSADPVSTGLAAGQRMEPGKAGAGTISGRDYQFSADRIDEAALSAAGAAGAGASSGRGQTVKKTSPASETADSAAIKEDKAEAAKPSDGEKASGNGKEKKVPDSERALMRSRRRHYRMIGMYVAFTVVVTYILIHLANNLGNFVKVAGKGVQMIGMLLAPLFWGFVVAYILSPAVDFFENRLRKKGSFHTFRNKPAGRRGPAVAVTYVLAFLFLGAILSIVASALSKSLRVASPEDLVLMIESLAGTLQSFQKTIQDWLAKMNISSNEMATAFNDIGETVAHFTSGLSKSITGTITQVGGVLTSAIFVVIFSIYFLLDKERILNYWNRVLIAVGGKKARRYCRILVNDADTVFSGYIRGQLIDALIMAVLVSVSLYLIGVKYAVIIGILSGIGNLIPYLGPVVAYGSTILVCLLSGDWKRLIVAIIVLFVIQTIDGNVINPRLLSSNVDVHPMLVIAALIIGGALGGVVGMLFAVPVAAFLKIQFDKIINRLLLVQAPEMAVQKEHTVKRKKKKKRDPAGAEEIESSDSIKSGIADSSLNSSGSAAVGTGSNGDTDGTGSSEGAAGTGAASSAEGGTAGSAAGRAKRESRRSAAGSNKSAAPRSAARSAGISGGRRVAKGTKNSAARRAKSSSAGSRTKSRKISKA